MQKTIFQRLLLILVCSFAVAPSAWAQVPMHTSVISGADETFGFNLLQKLNTKPTDNVFISPVSISEALGLLFVGADGQTKDEIGRALSIYPTPVLGGAIVIRPILDYPIANANFLDSLKSPDGSVQISIANALWAQNGVPFSPSYSKNAEEHFGATTHSVDFNQPISASSAINAWVSANTSGKITKLVTPSTVAGATMVLTNAVYFKGTWAAPFDINQTKPAPFTLGDGTVVQIPTMNRQGPVEVYFGPTVTVVRLHYSGTPSTSMVIALPIDPQAFDSFTQSLNSGTLTDWITNLRKQNVNLFMPKFHADYSAELTQSLTALGMKTAFSRSADFSLMGIKRAYVSGVVHQATMDVDEKGTVAAAATGVILHSLAIAVPRVVKIDHPFFCAITDDNTGTILFLGLVNHPQTAQ